MKYKEIKEKLINNGFKLKTVRDGEILGFEKHDIEGEILVGLNSKEIEDFDGLSFEDEWVDEITVNSISFNIDKSIPYSPKNSFSIYGDDNFIHLYGESLSLFDKALNIINNPLSTIDFAEEYSSELVKFNKKVKPLIESLKTKYSDLKVLFVSSGGYCVFPSLVYQIQYDKFETKIEFIFRTLDWQHYIYIGMIDMDDDYEMPIDISPEEFSKTIEKLQIENDGLFEKVKNNPIYKNRQTFWNSVL